MWIQIRASLAVSHAKSESEAGFFGGVMKLFFYFCILISFSLAMAQEQVSSAKKLVERIAGQKVPHDDPILNEVKTILEESGGAKSPDILERAAIKSMEHPGFLNITVKQMGLKMFTRAETLNEKLNDATAMLIGVTRAQPGDVSDARELLFGNFWYRAETKTINGYTIRSAPADLFMSNNHYADLDRPGIDLGKALVKVNGQKAWDGSAEVDLPQASGVLTSRAFLSAHADAGTNRRIIEYMGREFFCLTMGQWSDGLVTDIRVGKDISREPGGVHAAYLTSCKTCHTQMDSLRGAFSQFEWDPSSNKILHSLIGPHATNPLFIQANQANPGRGIIAGISAKMVTRNESAFPGGYSIIDDSWVNNGKGRLNKGLLGWRTQEQGRSGVVDSGRGPASLGALVANSQRFSQCMVKRVFEHTCRKTLELIPVNMPYVSRIVSEFEASQYQMKTLFKRVVISKECGT